MFETDFFSNMISPEMASQLLDYAVGLLTGLGTLIIGIFISSRLGRATRKLVDKTQRISNTLAPVAGSTVRYAGIVLTLVIALGQIGVETTSLIAVLGAAGLAIGLALQGTLANVAAGVMLLLLRPFEAGDWIETAGISGIAQEIGLFTTRIDTFDNVSISVPNSTIWSSTVINHARHRNRRLDLDIGIGYDSDLDKAEKALLSLCDDPRIHAEPTPVFLVTGYGDSAINVRLRLWADYDDLFALNWDLNRRLKPVLDNYGIEIPFPQRVVHAISEE
ncbi:MAG: mechanosensitive ion channel [Alphaproteobacteria bacterium]|jgi:small conductance mechanosensitive channel|nr:mechanosensitive ion channel [Alphaproteobacteria bacterium]